MESPPPPTQQQADEAQQARYAAERAILPLFAGEGQGAGGGEDDESILHALKIAAILAILSDAITNASFRDSMGVDHDLISETLEQAARREYRILVDADLTDEQRAVLWATWAYSTVASEVAAAIERGEAPDEYSGLNLKKVWISRSDRRVRPLHAKLHGKTVAIDTDFWRWPGTGQRLRYPGDRDAPAEATIGCRCVCLLSWASQDAVSDTIRRIVEHTEGG